MGNAISTLDNSFAFLPPEIVSDVIDQIAGRRRFTSDHLKLSQLEGMWGDTFRRPYSEFCGICAIGVMVRHVGNNGVARVSLFEHTKLPENIPIHSHNLSLTIKPNDAILDKFCDISHRLYGREVEISLRTDEIMNINDTRKVKNALDRLHLHFEGMRIEIQPGGTERLSYLIDFIHRMLQSVRFLRIFEMRLPNWNLEDVLLPFCLSDRFEFFRSEHYTQYSFQFIVAVFEGMKARKCPFDLKPRWIHVNVTQRTVRRLAGKYEMVPVRFLHYKDANRATTSWALKFWKQEQSSAMPEMSVEILLSRLNDWMWSAIVCLQKCNSYSLEQEVQRCLGGSTSEYGMQLGDDEVTAEVPFKTRTLRPENIEICGPEVSWCLGS